MRDMQQVAAGRSTAIHIDTDTRCADMSARCDARASTRGAAGSRSKRERGNDVHKAQGTAKRQVPVKGRGAAKPKPPPLALLISGARVSAKATAFGAGWARSTYGKRYESAELFGTVQRYSDLRAMGEIVQVKWDAGPGFESHDHCIGQT